MQPPPATPLAPQLLAFAAACAVNSPLDSASAAHRMPLPTDFPYDALPSPLPPAADPCSCPLDIFRVLIAAQLAAAAAVPLDAAYDAVEVLRDSSIADLCVAVPRLRVKGLTAADLAERFVPNEYVPRAVALGNFVNFHIAHPILRAVVFSAIVSRNSAYGCNSSGCGKVATLDMSSPNIAKPFHAGHLRSTIIGNFIRNVLNANGWKTVAINYLGDWGKQYGLLAVGFVRFGDEAALLRDPIAHLYEIYVRINQLAAEDATINEEARAYFKRMEDGDPEALALWRRFRELSIKRLDVTYERLGVPFDVYSGESQVTNIPEIMKLLEDADGLVVEDQGAQVIDLVKPEGLGRVIVRKSNGSMLYITRDIGAAYQRVADYAPDHMFYIVASQQDLHFRQLFATLARLGAPIAKECTHVSFGMVLGMSTRKGTVVFLEDILDQARDQMLEIMRRNKANADKIDDQEAVADIIGVSAVIVQDLSARRIKDYKFDWSRMLSFEGDTGPYLQYAHARLCSIERAPAAAELLSDPSALLSRADHVSVFASYAEGEPHAEVARSLIDRLVVMLARYPDLVRSAASSKQFEPCNLVTYLFQLCHLVSSLYEKVRALDANEDVRCSCVLMYHCARITLANGLRLLGLRPVSRM